MSPAFDRARLAAKRAYEIGRAKTSLLRATVVALAVGGLGLWAVGRASALLAVVPWLAWFVVETRGGALRAGGVRGVLAGAVTLALPMTILRPCCAPGEAMGTGACCAEPSMCWFAGIAVGVVAALAVPRLAEGKRLEASLGVVIGMSSVAMLRCVVMLEAEALGLLVGMLAGIAAASLARSWIASRSARA
jgi:hypothetical protein